MKVIVYVEGRSDEFAMQKLLEPLLQQKQQEGIAITFHAVPERENMADNKRALLIRMPQKAVDTLRNQPDSVIVIVPDLYPQNTAFAHTKPQQLFDGIRQNFREALQKKLGNIAPELLNRFHVFCFKHDLEALLLAAETGLARQLGKDRLRVTWNPNVEDQNHTEPPKRVVTALFKENGQRYKDTADAPRILQHHTYQEIADRCPQCFKPFVAFLENLPSLPTNGETL